MGKEINLMSKYPKAKRNLKDRKEQKTNEIRQIAKQFEEDFFDGDRKFGYGGFSYNPKYWTNVVSDFITYYELENGSSVLDVGCAKGFMLYDFYLNNNEIEIAGIDISEYAIANSKEEIHKFLQVADARSLPFEDNSFDLVISINTIHNLFKDDLIIALGEIKRVSKKHSFITVDAYRNNEEKEAMEAWNLTAETVLHVDDWKNLFEINGYEGDYYWFMP